MEMVNVKVLQLSYGNFVLLDDYMKLHKALKDLKDKLLSYGKTFDSDIYQIFQKECLKIIENIEV